MQNEEIIIVRLDMKDKLISRRKEESGRDLNIEELQF
jgi:hypothetical protein